MTWLPNKTNLITYTFQICLPASPLTMIFTLEEICTCVSKYQMRTRCAFVIRWDLDSQKVWTLCKLLKDSLTAEPVNEGSQLTLGSNRGEGWELGLWDAWPDYLIIKCAFWQAAKEERSQAPSLLTCAADKKKHSTTPGQDTFHNDKSWNGVSSTLWSEIILMELLYT